MFLTAIKVWPDNLSGRWSSRLFIVAILFIVQFPVVIAHGQTQSDTIYTDPGGLFDWIIPTQEVAGPDVEIWACHARLKRGVNQELEDTTVLKFFVPVVSHLSIEIRGKHHLSELRPGKMGWPKGFFQCLDLPGTILERLSLEPGNLLAVGKIQDPDHTRIMPIAWNAQHTDSLSYYEFKFKPNMDIEVSYSILHEIEPGLWIEIISESPRRFYPGKVVFTIKWNGHIEGRPAPEGYYKLLLKGSRFTGSQTLDLVRSYYFYHKGIFEPCLMQ